MNPESSPFRPGQPIPIEFFVGRRKEVERLHGMVKASVRGNFKIGFVSGERGIGKSSLAHFVRVLAEHESKTVGCQSSFSAGCMNWRRCCGARSTVCLLKDSMDKPWHEPIKSFFGNRIRKVGLFGVTLELNLAGDDLSMLAHDFVPSISQLLAQLKDRNEALLLILDDMNGLATSEVFANWLKSIVDEIATARQQIPLCVLFVGLEERRRELVRNQPSLARVFELIDITPWSDDEVGEFYKRAFESAGATISDDDLNVLASFTGGLPVLAHELGDAVWRTAQSPDIDANDIRKGVFLAAEVIGQKLLDPQIFQAIQSERYRSILRKMAVEVEPDLRFQRTELLARLTEDENRVLNNFLRRMRKLGVLERDPEVRGGYRFPNTLYSLYFMMEALRAGSKL